MGFFFPILISSWHSKSMLIWFFNVLFPVVILAQASTDSSLVTHHCVMLNQSEHQMVQGEVTSWITGQTFEVFGRRRKGGKVIAFIIRHQEEKAFLFPKGPWRLVKTKKTCDQLGLLPTTASSNDLSDKTTMKASGELPSQDLPSRWQWGVEGIYYINPDVTEHEQLQFSRNQLPLPSGNANEIVFDPPYDSILVPNPFIDSIGNGQAQQLGFFVEHRLWWALRQKWGLGYWQRQVTLETYPVPQTPSFNPIETLEREDRTHTSQGLYFRPEWRWSLAGLSLPNLSLSFGLQLNYVLINPRLEFRVGASDLVAIYKDLYKEVFFLTYHPRLEYQWGRLRFSIELSNPQHGIRPALALGWIF